MAAQDRAPRSRSDFPRTADRGHRAATGDSGRSRARPPAARPLLAHDAAGRPLPGGRPDHLQPGGRDARRGRRAGTARARLPRRRVLGRRDRQARPHRDRPGRARALSRGSAWRRAANLALFVAAVGIFGAVTNVLAVHEPAAQVVPPPAAPGARGASLPRPGDPAGRSVRLLSCRTWRPTGCLRRPLAGPDRLPRRVGSAARAGRCARRRGDRRPAAAPRARPRPDPGPVRRRRPRPGRSGRARAAGNRGHPRRARRRGHVPRPGPARRVPDPAALPPRPAAASRWFAPSKAPWSRPAPPSASQPTGATAIPAAGAPSTPAAPRKIGALGIRVERGVSYHGIALNVTVDLATSTSSTRAACPTSNRRRSRARRAGPTSARRPRASPAPRPPSRRRSRAGWGVDSTGEPARRRRRARPPDRAGRALRAAQGRDHRLVGRDRRRSRVPPRPVRARRAAGRRRRRVPQLPRARRRRRPRRGCSRTSRSTSSAPRRRRASWTARSCRSRWHRRGPRAAGGRSSRRRASIGRSTPSGPTSSRDLLAGCRDAIADARAAGTTDYLQVVQNWGAPGRRADEPPLPRPLRPAPGAASRRGGAGRRRAVRDPRGECPFCRLVREETVRGNRLVYEDAASVAFAPFASRSPFEVWVVPRRHAADFGDATDADSRSTAEALRQVLGRLATPRRPAVQPRPAHGAAARARRRDLPLALGDPPAPARDRGPRDRHRVCRSTRSRPRTPWTSSCASRRPDRRRGGR